MGRRSPAPPHGKKPSPHARRRRLGHPFEKSKKKPHPEMRRVRYPKRQPKRSAQKNLGGGRGWFWCGCAGLICAFAYFEAGEPADGDFFAEVGDGLIDFFADGHGFVFDEVL